MGTKVDERYQRCGFVKIITLPTESGNTPRRYPANLDRDPTQDGFEVASIP